MSEPHGSNGHERIETIQMAANAIAEVILWMQQHDQLAASFLLAGLTALKIEERVKSFPIQLKNQFRFNCLKSILYKVP